MLRKKAAFRKNRQHQWSVIAITVVVMFLCSVVWISSQNLSRKLESYQQRKEVLETLIAEETERAASIEEYRKYTKTKKFAEELAKDKLGLVYEGEIIFREEN